MKQTDTKIQLIIEIRWEWNGMNETAGDEQKKKGTQS